MEPIARATISATYEPSGEIRLALKLPARHIYRVPPLRYDEYGMPEAAPLVYSKKLGETPKSQAGFGALPKESHFSRHGKRFVKAAAGALEQRYGKKTLFGTVTLAGSTPQACAMLAAWSAKAVELLRHWIVSVCPDACFVYVWEWQKRGALHLHLALGSDHVEHLRSLRARFKTYIHRLHSTLSRLSGTDMFARNDGGSWRGFPDILRSRLEDVRKSVKRYLAKYLSKGGTTDGAFFPSRWWGCTKNLRRLVASYRECRVIQLTDFEAAVGIMRHQWRCWSEAELTVFTWCERFAPHNKTVVVYADENQCANVWEALLLVLAEQPQDAFSWCPAELPGYRP